ncbi:Metal tolerance protein 7 [Aphelenchoides besseyi]|nr:Metal tolerance protein 7 [Aphelenchoides besseyi]
MAEEQSKPGPPRAESDDSTIESNPLNPPANEEPPNDEDQNNFRRGIKLPFGKRYQVQKFYKDQSRLLENYENDSRQVQDDKNRRSLRMPSNQDGTETQFLVESVEGNGSEEVTEHITGIIKVHPEVPRINLRESDDCYDGRALAEDSAERQKRNARAHCLAKITLLINISLTIAKAFASYLSGSLSIISSLVDSLVDITSGVVIWATSRAIRKHDPYHYPAGRTRLEPVALIIVSVIMAVASVQMIVQSLESIINFNIDPHVNLPTLIIMISTILLKGILFIVCRRYCDNPSVQILAQDHLNDCLSNSVALICAFCAQRFWVYLDPLGAIVVACYIAITWYLTGKEQLVRLSGKSAEPEFINRIIKLCLDHDPLILYIDTVYVYHFGTRFLVEIHVVMNQELTLKVTHDVSESLQNSIESLPDVERAFVHVDYEFEHKPGDEHAYPNF